ncbi:hypothetical protein HSBAA_30010 [Vreelandella sulfidaeris]|uniref:Uncharacterized protein n=1 Tax=Vreelandella sulfidaeris TaxID=115553 RepID=A0A455U6V1_9GAMM|nr:hypothetical protein HSBAA_30010 [Halomonas sulfidaeris]
MSERGDGGQEIVYLPPKDLIPYEKNVKKHPQKHIDTPQGVDPQIRLLQRQRHSG